MSHNEVECGCVLRACGMCFGPGLQKLWPKYVKAPRLAISSLSLLSLWWLQKCF